MPDSGTQDSGTQDRGTQDSGTQDSGTQDSGMRDSGMRDSGMRDGGLRGGGAGRDDRRGPDWILDMAAPRHERAPLDRIAAPAVRHAVGDVVAHLRAARAASEHLMSLALALQSAGWTEHDLASAGELTIDGARQVLAGRPLDALLREP